MACIPHVRRKLVDAFTSQRNAITGEAIRSALSRMSKARPYLENSHPELDSNNAHRAVKPVAIGRKNWMFAGSERGSNAMTIAFTLTEIAKMHGVVSQAWLTSAPVKISDHEITRLHDLMPWRTLLSQRSRENRHHTKAPSPGGYSERAQGQYGARE